MLAHLLLDKSGRKGVLAVKRMRVVLLVVLLGLLLGQPLLVRAARVRLVVGRSYRLAAGMQLPGDLVAFGGDLYLAPGSAVEGSVVAYGGSLDVAGRVQGSALAPGGTVTLRAGAAVGGDVLAGGGVQREPGATVRGRAGGPLGASCLAFLPGPWFGWAWRVDGPGGLLVWLVQALLGCLAGVALGLLAATLAPRRVHRSSRAVLDCPLRTLAVGLLAGPAALALAALLALTVVCLPLAMLGLGALAIAAAGGWAAAGLALGERLARREGPAAGALGLAVLSLASALPYTGATVGAIGAAWGLGGLLLTRLGAAPFMGEPPRVAPPH